MDFKQLANVTAENAKQTQIKDSTDRDQVLERLRNNRNKKEVADALAKRKAAREAQQIADAKKYENFKITDAFKNLKQKIKDEMEGTETTADAIEVAISNITPEVPAEQVVAAVVEVLGETIDALEEQVALDEAPAEEEVPAEEEPAEE